MIDKIKRLFQRTNSHQIKGVDPKDYSTIDSAGGYIPCQVEAYFVALNSYISEGDKVLDVGFGLGYGLSILSIKAKEVCGVDIDPRTLEFMNQHCWGRNPKIKNLQLYDGYHLPYKSSSFDVVTCIDVLEHVEKYDDFLKELMRVSKKGILISTPNRRPEYTNLDGSPKNYWHLREWSKSELNIILKRHGTVSWNVLNGPFSGPFSITKSITSNSLTLTPFIRK